MNSDAVKNNWWVFVSFAAAGTVLLSSPAHFIFVFDYIGLEERSRSWSPMNCWDSFCPLVPPHFFFFYQGAR